MPVRRLVLALARALVVAWALSASLAWAQGSLGPIVFAPAEEDIEPVDPTDRFPEGVRVVYAFFEFRNLSATDIIGGVWYRGDEIVLSQATTVAQILRNAQPVPTGKLYFAITFDEGAPAGAYRLELTLNSVPVQSGTFTVEPAANAGGRAGPPAQTLPLTCETTAQQIEGGPGTVATGTCPAGCDAGNLWGTGTYTDDSSICRAAAHAGAIPAEGGPVAITIRAGREAYEGTTRNGVTSRAYGAWGRSFSVAPAGDATAPVPGGETAAIAECAAPPDHVAYRSPAHGYCIAHRADWEVEEDEDGNTTFELPAEGAPERMGLFVNVTPLEAEIPLDAAVEAFLPNFLEPLRRNGTFEVLGRSETVVAGREARMATIGGQVRNEGELVDVEGRIYLLYGAERRLYSLVFMMDTTHVPLEDYLPTLDAMLGSFRLGGTGAE